MAEGQKRGSRAGDTESRAAPGADGEESAVAAVDELLPQVASGDAEAFASVYDLVAGAVYGLASQITGDQARAEQVAAEVLLEVWRSAPRFSPAEGSGLSWIMTMARRRAMSQAAARDGSPAGLGSAGAAGVIAERGAGSLLAHHGLASMPGPQREAVTLACCGYTSRQAADLLGVSPGKVAARLRDGLLRLRGHPPNGSGGELGG